MFSPPPSDGLIEFQRACRPADFSYKHDAQHNSVFVMAQLWDDSDDIIALQSLVRILDSAQMSTSERCLDFVQFTLTILGQAPIASLRPIFLYLRKSGTLPRVHSRLLEILRPSSSFLELDVDISGTPGGTNEVKDAFQRNLKKYLFGCRDLLSLRLRLSVADFCWVCGVYFWSAYVVDGIDSEFKRNYSEDQQKQVECGQIALQILSAISQRVLHTIIRHLGGIIGFLSCLSTFIALFSLKNIGSHIKSGRCAICFQNISAIATPRRLP